MHQLFPGYSNLLFGFIRDLVSEIHSSLSERVKRRPLVVLVDGVDIVQDGKGQFSSDWIPQLLPQVGYERN